MALIQDEGILIAQRTQGKQSIQCFLRPDKANRHGLITGATGTGKTITLQTLAEGFSNQGMPVFLAEIKGDLTGLSQAGGPKITQERGLLSPTFSAFPTT
jgi:DNA helicase HerA-like ATPase